MSEDREIVLRTYTTGDDDWETVVLNESELLADREELLRKMEITYDEFVALHRDSRCSCCSRPDWTDRWSGWRQIENIDWLLGVDTSYGRT